MTVTDDPLRSPPFPKTSNRFNRNVIFCEDLEKPQGSISTGVGYLDHMIDQFNSHAQIGISLTIADFAEVENNGDNGFVFESVGTQNHNRYAQNDQAKLMSLVGSKIGTEFKRLLTQSATAGTSSRFCCPLDEALVACEIKRVHAGELTSFTLPPYGTFPSTGRKTIGRMETDKLAIFWQCLAEHADISIVLRKVRGDNAHHIVEASFKAFARAIRNLLDGIDTRSESSRTLQLYDPESKNWQAGTVLGRQGSVTRKTKETSISATLRMDGSELGVHVNCGIKTLDTFLTLLATTACMSLDLTCHGDLWIDEHHTAEDVAIALGQVLTDALGTKAGLNRMWCASAEQNQTKIEVTMDLSNRPCFTHNLGLDNGEETVGDLSLEMFEHILDSIVVNARMTVHILEVYATNNLEDTVQAVAIAFGQALKYCAMVDSRRAGATASSKGTLSV